MTPLSKQMQDLSSAFAREGYVTLPKVVSKSKLAALTEDYDRWADAFGNAPDEQG